MAIDTAKRNKRQKEWVKENRDQLNIYVPKGTKDRWKYRAEKDGKTLSQWIVDKVEETGK